ncbi:MAG: hypothetical protein JSU69_03655 [Candidatus Zixiibacteriota bacterium]|nr:MAG: hypothetical protein JSU69_03655 [candidate division Zixibacteria bacterium]
MKYIIFALFAVLVAAFCLSALPDISDSPSIFGRNNTMDVVIEKIGNDALNRALAVQTTGQSLRDAESTGFC